MSDEVKVDGGSLRDNAGKLRYDLLPTDAVAALVKVFSYGAEKHTCSFIDGSVPSVVNYLAEELEKCRIVVKECVLYTASVCADPAMKNLFVMPIPISPSGNGRTVDVGEDSIRSRKETRTDGVFSTPHSGAAIGKPSFVNIADIVGSLRSRTTLCLNSKIVNAQSVEKNIQDATAILIMTISQGTQEASYVAVATEGWGCLRILLDSLKRLSPTLKTLRLGDLSGAKQIRAVRGDRNWERGQQWSVPYASCMRHLQSWFAGENTDPESGLPHLAHAACNLLFLLAYQLRGMTFLDDREHLHKRDVRALAALPKTDPPDENEKRCF